MALTELCRLEQWSPDKNDWVQHHAGVGLLHPDRYVERLAAKGKVARVTILDDRLQPDRVITAESLGLKQCPFCDGFHPEPHTGMCLI